MLCWLSDIFMTHDVLYAKPVYYGNDICSALFIFSQRQTFALHQTLGACSSSDAEKKNAYRTKISVLPQKHLAELKRIINRYPALFTAFLT